MPTLSPLIARTQPPSHWVSWGQTRPQTAGKEEDILIMLYASSYFFSFIFPIKAGISIETGHFELHGLFLQFKHLFASFIACSSL